MRETKDDPRHDLSRAAPAKRSTAGLLRGLVALPDRLEARP